MKASSYRFLPFVFLLALSLIPLPHVTDTGPFGLPSLCGFRILTGLPCPACGLTRSVVCAAQGRWELAFDFHPLGSVVWAGLLAFAFSPILRRVSFFRHVATSETVRTWAVGIGAGLLVLIWALRLLQILPTPP